MSLKCPICKGKGVINKPVPKDRMINNAIMTKLLRKEGYTIRQIMRFLEYKSPQSIQRLLNK
jgi:hypothetical protein